MTAFEPLHGHPVQGSSDRSFGLVFTVFFLLVGLSPFRHSQPVRVWALVASGIFLLFSLVRPSALAPLNRLWTRFGILLARVTNPVVLGLIYFLILTPFAWMMRRAGRDPLRLKLDKQAESYWIPIEPERSQGENMRHQF